MKHKYELNRRYAFEATADSVCPVPDDARVIIWIGTRSEPIEKASRWTWDRDGIITHFLVTSYPKTKHNTWVNCYPNGLATMHYSRVVADEKTNPDRIKCIEIEWEEE